MDLFKQILQGLLREGLIKTVPIDRTVSVLANQLKGYAVKKSDRNDNKFTVSLRAPDYSKIDSILKFTNNLGWFPSKGYYKDKKGQKTEVNWSDVIKRNLGDMEILVIKFEAKYDFSSDSTPELLYHVTPTVNWKRIEKRGLSARSKSKLSQHPERVYLAKTQQDAEELLPQFNKHDERIKDYSILQITTALVNSQLKLYKDPNYQDKGFYTMDNIPPSAIKKIKDIHVS